MLCLRSSILSDIVVNATPRETRIALLEQRIVTELFIERHTNPWSCWPHLSRTCGENSAWDASRFCGYWPPKSRLSACL